MGPKERTRAETAKIEKEINEAQDRFSSLPAAPHVAFNNFQVDEEDKKESLKRDHRQYNPGIGIYPTKAANNKQNIRYEIATQELSEEEMSLQLALQLQVEEEKKSSARKLEKGYTKEIVQVFLRKY